MVCPDIKKKEKKEKKIIIFLEKLFHILPLRDVVGMECDLVKLQMLNYRYVAIITDPGFDVSLLILVERFPVSIPLG